jgi:ABC-type bacteriocin/lantibiotic exporter with double-glycine peptidase domain
LENSTKVEEKRKTDSYLESLQFISKYFEKNVSKESLSAGILSQGKMMDLADLIKSASRIGLITKIVDRKLIEISQLF